MSPEERWEHIRKADTYREFLKIYLSVYNLSLSDFARASGFGRGFPGDVISGKRRLTGKSSFRFERALKLPASGRRFFRLLVAVSEEDLYPELDRAKVPEELKQLRREAWKRSRTHTHENMAPKFQRQQLDKKMIAVYAAAGDPATGASLKKLESRTGFSESEVLKFSKDLERLKLLEFKTDSHVVPKDQHLFLQTTDQSALLKQTFRQSAHLALNGLSSKADKKEEFYFSSSFCIRAEKLGDLKKELRETILKFIDNSIEDEGSRVVHLLTALHL